jgi:hypothetical protein
MDRETILENITRGDPRDNDHIRYCLDLISNEPDDLVRIYARLWLERHSPQLAQRVLNQD